MTVRDPKQYEVECTRIDDFDLQGEYVRVSADLAYWNSRYADAYKTWRESSLTLEQMTASLSMVIRDQLTSQNKGRVTVAEVEQWLLATPDYQRLKQSEIDAEYEKVRLNGVVDAIRTKKEMLISLGAHLRAEMGNDPAIRNARYVADEVVRNRTR